MRNGLLFVSLVVVGVAGLQLGGILNADVAVGVMLLVGIGSLMMFFYLRRNSTLTQNDRETYARKLRSTRERERAFYDLATTLSSTLDFQKVLDAAQEIGKLATRDPNPNDRLISAAFLYQANKTELHPISSRGLTARDSNLPTPGQEGILGLARQQDDPIFGTLARKDAELCYYVGFQACQSIVAMPLRTGYEEFGVLVFGSEKSNAFTDEALDMLKAIGKQATIALQNAFLYQSLLTEKNRIVEVEEDARKKLARDLHDGPTQSVANIAMRVNFIRRNIDRQPQQAIEELGKVEELARRTTKDIRHMLFTMRPLILETQGLTAALNQLSEKMRDTYETNVVIECEYGVEKWLDTHAQGIAFYIIEEAVNNARKHAQSDHIWVRIRKQGAHLVIEIQDDGVGFNLKAVSTDYHLRGSLGMINMRERAELIEGKLHLESEEGTGTKISIVVPVREPMEVGEHTLPITHMDNPLKMSAAPLTPAQKDNSNIPYATKRSPSS